MRVNPLQNAFTGGLLSARLATRNDVEAVNSGLRQSMNGVILPHGGHMRRSGTHYVATAKNRVGDTCLLPFEVSAGQQYVIEAGKVSAGVGYFRFFANNGVVGGPTEVATVFDDPTNIRLAQSADTLYLVHPSHEPYVLIRTAFSTFTLSTVQSQLASGEVPPMRTNNGIAGMTITAGAGFLAASGPAFVVGKDEGRFIVVEDAGSISVYRIDVVNSTSNVSVTIFTSGSWAGGATGNWQLGAFSYTEGPRAVTLHEGRLWYGGTATQPDLFWGSVSDQFNNFNVGTTTGSSPTIGLADRSIRKRIVSEQLNTIQWMKSFGQIMSVGCSGGEFRVFGANNNVLQPLTTVVKAATAAGCASIPAIRADNAALFVQRSKRGLYELQYDVLRDQLTIRDLNLYSQDIYDPAANGLQGLQRTSYQVTPDPVIWGVKGDGSVTTLTYNPAQKIAAAGFHSIGAEFPIGTPSPVAGKILDVCVIANNALTAQTPWFVGDFLIAGVTQRYIMYQHDYYIPPGINRRSSHAALVAALNVAYFVDLGIETTFGSPTSVVSGLGHLEGCTVDVLIDGKVHPQRVVVGGSITAAFPGLHFVVGLPMPYYAETERFTGGAKLGSDLGFPSKTARVGVSLQNTLGGHMGVGNGLLHALEAFKYPGANQSMDTSPPLYSGVLDVPVEGSWDDERTIYWENNQPLPMTVLGITPRQKIGERG